MASNSFDAGDTPTRCNRRSVYHPSSGRAEQNTTPKPQVTTIHSSHGRTTVLDRSDHDGSGERVPAGCGDNPVRVSETALHCATECLASVGLWAIGSPPRWAVRAGASSAMSIQVVAGKTTATVIAAARRLYRIAAEARRIAPNVTAAQAQQGANCQIE